MEDAGETEFTTRIIEITINAMANTMICQREIEWLKQVADSEIFKQEASPFLQ